MTLLLLLFLPLLTGLALPLLPAGRPLLARGLAAASALIQLGLGLVAYLALSYRNYERDSYE